MGRILMKCLTDPACRISASLSVQEKRQHLFYTLLTVFLFAVGSAAFFEFIYELCNMIGSIVSGTPSQAIVELRRMLPIQLTAFTEVYMAVCVFNAYRAKDPAARGGVWKRHGVVEIILGALIALYCLVGMIDGQYAGPVEGFPTLLFPLDFCLIGIGIIVLGIFVRRHGRKAAGREVFVSCHIRGRFRLFHVISYMIALQSAAACVCGLFIMDWKHGMILYNIVLWLNYFTVFAMAACYRFVYVETVPQYRKKVSLKLGLLFLLVNIILFMLYIVLSTVYNEAPGQNAFGIQPIDFTASFNAFLVLMGLNNLIAPLVAVLNGVFGRADIAAVG